MPIYAVESLSGGVRTGLEVETEPKSLFTRYWSVRGSSFCCLQSWKSESATDD